jgi:hypothetical protein
VLEWDQAGDDPGSTMSAEGSPSSDPLMSILRLERGGADYCACSVACAVRDSADIRFCRDFWTWMPARTVSLLTSGRVM